MIKVNVGVEGEFKIIKVSSLLVEQDRAQLIELIKKYEDYFAWNNYEVPRLARRLVEHKLPIKEGFRPHK